jgi:hypothetical protein
MCTQGREMTLPFLPSQPSGQIVDFLAGNKNHTYAFPLLHTYTHVKRYGVCPLVSFSFTHTCLETQMPLSEAQAGQRPAEQGFHEHWITRNLSRALPSPNLCPNSDCPPQDPPRWMKRARRPPPRGLGGQKFSL